jgi:hypothetical protein
VLRFKRLDIIGAAALPMLAAAYACMPIDAARTYPNDPSTFHNRWLNQRPCISLREMHAAVNRATGCVTFVHMPRCTLRLNNSIALGYSCGDCIKNNLHH